MPDSFAGFDIVEVRFKGGRKEFMRNDQRLPLVTGDAVVVDAAGSGWHLGHVSLKGELVRLQMRKKKVPTDSKEIRNILRIATPDDVERWEAVRDLENGTMFRARAMVGELRLRMKNRIDIEATRDLLETHPTISYWIEKEQEWWDEAGTDLVVRAI